jgi:hypothetical protein
MRTAFSLTVVLIAALTSVGCGNTAPGCRRNEECGGATVICLQSRACATKCTDNSACTDTEKCSTSGGGGCVPKGGCGADNECAKGQVCEGVTCVSSCATASCASGRTCQSNGHCSDPVTGPTGPTCGGELFQASRVQANFLIVLDQSGSMEEVLPAGGSKWSLATAAIKTVTGQNEASIRFGLSMFPGATKCTEGSNFVPVSDAAAAPISASMPPNAKGNGTPIGAALTLASARPELTDPTRANFVLLVTDGMENCGGDPVAAVKALAGRGIKTYVVGFGADVDPARLAQMAVEGGTERLGNTKYYQADDQASLNGAFKQIAQGAAGCDYKLAKEPPDLNKIYVAVDGNLINHDASRKMGWDYNQTTGRLTLYGGACDVVQKSSRPNVQIVYGCPDPSIIEGGGNGDGGYPPVSSDGGIN